MKNRLLQSGFSVIELVILVAVVGLIGFVGYTYVSSQQDQQVADTKSAPKTEAAPNAVAVKTAPVVNVVSDLDKADATLDQLDSELDNSGDLNTLDSQVDAF